MRLTVERHLAPAARESAPRHAARGICRHRGPARLQLAEPRGGDRSKSQIRDLKQATHAEVAVAGHKWAVTVAAIRMAECPISPSQGAALLNGQIVPGRNRATAIVAMRQVVKTISKFALTDSHLNGNTRAIISSESPFAVIAASCLSASKNPNCPIVPTRES